MPKFLLNSESIHPQIYHINIESPSTELQLFLNYNITHPQHNHNFPSSLTILRDNSISTMYIPFCSSASTLHKFSSTLPFTCLKSVCSLLNICIITASSPSYFNLKFVTSIPQLCLKNFLTIPLL
ncbi:hypothetical protein AYI69_g3414 [Smittium culicis]|uniref:Uncharacterized protein n=1 Tax=Smittium culicis TaxID=133412 RepID=A0A1R1YJX0_9FUNG|nr:hypothetical protein AYI69_g3414 [Smittium culicis]